MYSIQEAADFLKISEEDILFLIKSEKIGHEVVQYGLMVTNSQISSYLVNNASFPQKKKRHLQSKKPKNPKFTGHR
jgi:hypothetical protein